MKQTETVEKSNSGIILLAVILLTTLFLVVVSIGFVAFKFLHKEVNVVKNENVIISKENKRLIEKHRIDSAVIDFSKKSYSGALLKIETLNAHNDQLIVQNDNLAKDLNKKNDLINRLTHQLNSTKHKLKISTKDFNLAKLRFNKVVDSLKRKTDSLSNQFTISMADKTNEGNLNSNTKNNSVDISIEILEELNSYYDKTKEKPDLEDINYLYINIEVNTKSENKPETGKAQFSIVEPDSTVKVYHDKIPKFEKKKDQYSYSFAYQYEPKKQGQYIIKAKVDSNIVSRVYKIGEKAKN